MLKKFLKFNLYVFIGGFVIGLILLGYVYFIEPNRLIVKEISLTVPNWSKELNGFKVAAISDIHGGSHTITEAKILSIVEKINSQNPDIVVILGDFVSQIHDDSKVNREDIMANREKNKDLKMPMKTIAENLKGLKAKFGVFAVIGNHDWWYDEKDCRQMLENVGFTVLEDETKSFEANGKSVIVVGFEDFWKYGNKGAQPLFARLPKQENIIGITHNPDTFERTTDALTILFAGHTHGGQVNFPIIGAPIIPASKEFSAGHVVKNGRHLFVTTGIGTSGLPFRFRVPPEIVVLTLNSQN